MKSRTHDKQAVAPRAAATSQAHRDATPQAAQRAEGPGVDDSPRQSAQRRRLGAAYGPAALASPAPVQRAVGFEFQMRHWELVRDKPQKGRGEGATVVDEGKGRALQSGTGWSMESDGGEPEIILGHVDETDPATANTAASKALKAGMVISNSMGKNGEWAQVDKYSKPRSALKIVPKAGAEDPVTADVQITGGFRFERLTTLFSQLSQRDPGTGQSGTQANKELMQNKAVKHYSGDDITLGKALVSVGKSLNKAFPSFDNRGGATVWTDDVKNDAHGILTLLGSYLVKSKELGHAYIKDFPLLSKSNLATVVAASPLAQAPWAAQHAALIDVLLEASGRGTAELLYPSTNPTGDMKDDGPTVGAWLNGLFTGTDLLSYLDNRSFADNSMGNLRRLDAPGGAAAPILELRRINNNMPATDWVPFVKRSIEWVARMNDLNEDQLDF